VIVENAPAISGRLLSRRIAVARRDRGGLIAGVRERPGVGGRSVPVRSIVCAIGFLWFVRIVGEDLVQSQVVERGDPAREIESWGLLPTLNTREISGVNPELLTGLGQGQVFQFSGFAQVHAAEFCA